MTVVMLYCSAIKLTVSSNGLCGELVMCARCAHDGVNVFAITATFCSTREGLFLFDVTTKVSNEAYYTFKACPGLGLPGSLSL